MVVGGNDNRFDEENQCVEKCITDVSTNEPGKGDFMKENFDI